MTNDDLKKVAVASLDMIAIHEASYRDGEGYTKSIEQSAQEAVAKEELPEGLWYLLFLASQWGNDIQDWVEHVLADKPMSEML